MCLGRVSVATPPGKRVPMQSIPPLHAKDVQDRRQEIPRRASTLGARPRAIPGPAKMIGMRFEVMGSEADDVDEGADSDGGCDDD